MSREWREAKQQLTKKLLMMWKTTMAFASTSVGSATAAAATRCPWLVCVCEVFFVCVRSSLFLSLIGAQGRMMKESDRRSIEKIMAHHKSGDQTDKKKFDVSTTKSGYGNVFMDKKQVINLIFFNLRVDRSSHKVRILRLSH